MKDSVWKENKIKCLDKNMTSDYTIIMFISGAENPPSFVCFFI